MKKANPENELSPLALALLEQDTRYRAAVAARDRRTALAIKANKLFNAKNLGDHPERKAAQKEIVQLTEEIAFRRESFLMNFDATNELIAVEVQLCRTAGVSAEQFEQLARLQTSRKAALMTM